MMKFHYVYKITNIINGKVYIGKSINPVARFNKHVSIALTRTKNQYFYLQASIHKYGKDSFKLDIIEQCNDAKSAYDREIYWIKYYQSNNPEKGMNLTIGGDGSKGHVLSKEAKAKISAAQKGRKMPEWHKQKISAANTGKIVSAETRKKMSDHQQGSGNHQYGKHISEEHKAAISKASKEKVVSDETRELMRQSAFVRFSKNPLSVESRAKIAIARTGKPQEYGENHHAAKLKEEDVLKIRKMHKEGHTYKELSNFFGIASSTISKIVKRERWKHLP